MVETSDDLEARDRALFNRISQSYARKDLVAASRAARHHRLVQTLRRIDLSGDAAVLEIGCGAGYAATYLDGVVGSYHGLDYAGELIAYAKQNNGRLGATFLELNAKDLPQDLQFDMLFMIGVLHHLDDVPTVLRTLQNNLRPGGWFIANEPQRGNPVVRGLRWIRKKTDRNYSEDQREYSGRELKELYCAAGFENVCVFPQGLFSTPFAEVVMPAQVLAKPFSRAACVTDGWLERHLPRVMGPLAWNVVAQGQKPE